MAHANAAVAHRHAGESVRQQVELGLHGVDDLNTRCSLPSLGENATSIVPVAGSVVELFDW